MISLALIVILICNISISFPTTEEEYGEKFKRTCKVIGMENYAQKYVGSCNLVIYSNMRYINENGVWKERIVKIDNRWFDLSGIPNTAIIEEATLYKYEEKND